MNPLTLEWVEKAEADYATARRELRARKFPNYDAACFHAQQMAEKYLKACLQENGAPIPRTHNLVVLMDQCAAHDGSFALQRDLLVRLDRYAVVYRYPGESADRDEAKLTVRAADDFRHFARQRLGLPD